MTLSATNAAPAADPLLAMFAAPAELADAVDPLAAFRAAFETALATPVEGEVEIAAVSEEEARLAEVDPEEEPVEARVAIAACATPPSAARPFVWTPPVRIEARETENAVSTPLPESGAAPPKTAMEAPVEIGAPEPVAAPQALHSPEAFALRLQDAAAADGPQNEPQETQSVERVEPVAASAPRLAQNRNDEPAAQQRDQPEPRKEAPEVRSGDAPVRAASAIPAPSSGMPAAAAHPDAPQAARIEPPAGTAAAQALEPVEAPREPVSASGPPRLALRVGGPDRAPEASLELDLTSPATRPAVDVIVEQRRGDVHFSVRSADPLLVQDLRGSVGELTGRLEQSGYRAETWTPAETFRTAEPLASRSADSRFQEDSGERGGGWTGQDSRNPSRDGQRQPDGERPRWLIELEESFFGSGAKRA